MNSSLTKASAITPNKVSTIILTLASATFFLYTLGQAPILKNFLAGAFSCSSAG